MDDRRFDDLTKSLTKLTPRRAAVRLLSGGALASVLAALGVAALPARRAGASHTCPVHDDCCAWGLPRQWKDLRQRGVQSLSWRRHQLRRAVLQHQPDLFR